MSMFYACDQDGMLVYIDDARRGLACRCHCLVCGEAVVAKKGQRNTHHFAHHGGKSACDIAPESILHKLAKQVILQAEGLQLPPLPGVYPSPNDPEADKTSWWDFAEIHAEQTQQSFRPDLVAKLKDGTQLLIEIAVTSFVDEHKQEKIDRLQDKTVELNLRYLLDQMHKPYLEIRQHILHDTQHKTWLYPHDPEMPQDDPATAHSESKCLPFEDKGMIHPDAFVQHRFTVLGMWLGAMRLPSGDLVVRSYAYNPQIVQLLKAWAGELGGRYSRRYKNWSYPAKYAGQVLERLGQLHDETA